MKLTYRGFFFFGLLASVLTGCSATGQEMLQDTPARYTVQPDAPSPDHSGMWLLPQVDGALYEQMTEMGLNLPPEELYNDQIDNSSLNHAVLRINVGEGGGGTGSFVSGEGLILTNHHVAYDGIAGVSGTEQNYLQTGFYAENYRDELPLTNYSLYIPIEQTEVTGQIESAIPKNAGNRLRAEIKATVSSEIIEARRDGNEDLMVEINDFWSGNRQFMSVYKIIRDVRLVYAPEQAIGKFGGDIDNWMWPRHTGDYAFLRAYVSEDGVSAPYQPGNVPYTPERHLKVNERALSPGDFTMTLGFPGSTYRFESSPAFSFYQDQQFPVLYSAFKAYLNGLEMQAANNPETAASNAAERASIANALKYYEGLIEGFQDYDVVSRKIAEDQEFVRWAESDSLRKSEFGRVMPQLEQAYQIARQSGDVLYLTFYSLQFSNLLQMGSLFNDFYEYSQAPDSVFYSSDERQQLYDQVRTWQAAIDMEAELLMLTEMLQAMAELPEERRPLILYRFFGSPESETLKQEIQKFITRQASGSVLTDTTIAASWIFSELQFSDEAFTDSLYLVSRDIFETFELSRENYSQHFQYLQPAQKRYAEGMIQMTGAPSVYADANFTLRLSAGQIMGYVPADGVYYTPFTTYSGMLAKHTGDSPFDVPEQLQYFSDSELTADSSMYLNFLSTNDITGGNSGSPVLDGNGELIGLAFDGNIEGIVSDYYVVPDAARTISVDIRYILFVMRHIHQTERLLLEMEAG
ncbi:S46 family peptidase [Rhodohalobacter mucosus]|uniref:Dipeptidyl-peptidase n=1 Tax=Rhodohalobacter mucosus TaxID=2079485 RepID=A0A316TPJ3_9BACT|nr:S46 family peptidase [Rhodohalobacter mucosus]PWN05581.1 hypothetical protein DDZ15_13340 [Rhodohalobacter mucosus]